MHIGMQSYAAAAHLAARVYNEQQVRCNAEHLFSAKKQSKRVYAGRSLLCVSAGAQHSSGVGFLSVAPSLFFFFAF